MCPGGHSQGWALQTSHPSRTETAASPVIRIRGRTHVLAPPLFQAPVSGSKQPAIDGQLIILASGDASLFKAAQPAFALMGKRSFYLGALGAGARMKLVVNQIMGSMMVRRERLH